MSASPDEIPIGIRRFRVPREKLVSSWTVEFFREAAEVPRLVVYNAGHRAKQRQLARWGEGRTLNPLIALGCVYPDGVTTAGALRGDIAGRTSSAGHK